MPHVSPTVWRRPRPVTSPAGIALAGLLGLPIGSFLTVVAHRVPAGRSIVSPGSACPACGAPIAPRDNIPVLSYLLQKGRCRRCSARISPRYVFLEVATALLFCLVAARTAGALETAAFCTFVAGLLALSVIDLEHLRLPTPIIVVTGAIGALLFLSRSLQIDRYGSLIHALVVAGVAGGALLVVYLAVPRAIGLGDVRLAGLCGFFLGWLGYRVAAVSFLVGFLAGGVVGVLVLLGGRAGRKTRLAFGPFLALGGIIGVLAGAPLAHLWLG